MKAQEVADHLIGEGDDWNEWVGRSEYVNLDENGRTAVRYIVAQHVMKLLVEGDTATLANRAIEAESVCNFMSHLFAEAVVEDDALAEVAEKKG